MYLPISEEQPHDFVVGRIFFEDFRRRGIISFPFAFLFPALSDPQLFKEDFSELNRGIEVKGLSRQRLNFFRELFQLGTVFAGKFVEGRPIDADARYFHVEKDCG